MEKRDKWKMKYKSFLIPAGVLVTWAGITTITMMNGWEDFYNIDQDKFKKDTKKEN